MQDRQGGHTLLWPRAGAFHHTACPKLAAPPLGCIPARACMQLAAHLRSRQTPICWHALESGSRSSMHVCVRVRSNLLIRKAAPVMCCLRGHPPHALRLTKAQ